MSAWDVHPVTDWRGAIAYYQIEGADAWAGSDDPGYLFGYVRGRLASGDMDNAKRAGTVLAYRMSQMPLWRYWWWRLRVAWTLR